MNRVKDFHIKNYCVWQDLKLEFMGYMHYIILALQKLTIM